MRIIKLSLVIFIIVLLLSITTGVLNKFLIDLKNIIKDKIEYGTIYEEFNGKKFVKIYVKIIDKNNYLSEQDKINWFNSESNKILNNISNTEKQNVRKTLFGFTVEITKDGFDNLTKQSNIERILLQENIPPGKSQRLK